MSNLSAARAPASEPWIDWGKAIAAQCIVWHHLVHYGPLAPRLRLWLPRLVDWLDQRALLAVQVFLVMGGYLAARSLWPQPGRPRITLADWPRRMAQRWRRLMPVYLAALALALLGAALARHGMQDADTPAAPTLAQLAANALLLQDVLGQDALSAGLWYVAIDLQLFALLAALAAVAALWQPAATPPPWRGHARSRRAHVVRRRCGASRRWARPRWRRWVSSTWTRRATPGRRTSSAATRSACWPPGAGPTPAARAGRG